MTLFHSHENNFGSESKGISAELLALCDACVFVPCPGPMRSMNVSQCVAAVLFEWLRQEHAAGRSGGAPVARKAATALAGVAAAGAVAMALLLLARRAAQAGSTAHK